MSPQRCSIAPPGLGPKLFGPFSSFSHQGLRPGAVPSSQDDGWVTLGIDFFTASEQPRSGEIYVAQRVSAGKSRGHVTSRGAATPRWKHRLPCRRSAANEFLVILRSQRSRAGLPRCRRVRGCPLVPPAGMPELRKPHRYSDPFASLTSASSTSAPRTRHRGNSAAGCTRARTPAGDRNPVLPDWSGALPETAP